MCNLCRLTQLDVVLHPPQFQIGFKIPYHPHAIQTKLFVFAQVQTTFAFFVIISTITFSSC